MRFIHTGDCHLGGWRIPELQELNLKHFQHVIDTAIKEKVDFFLVAGDLFDSPYPPIDTIKDTFNEFRKLKEAKIPVFMIAGSHDYSVSGKTFLDVLEKSGFATNVFRYEERDGKIVLLPTIYKSVAIYGYPGKKSGYEVDEVSRIKIQDSPGLFRILMLHTTLRDAVPALPIPAVDEKKLPKVDYVAMAHLHLKYEKENRIYCGPSFPNNSGELEELKCGSFYLVDTAAKAERKEIKIKEVKVIDLEIEDAFEATEKIRKELEKSDIKDKILILKLKGILERGKVSDINLQEIEKFSKEKKVYAFLKNTTKLQSPQTEIKVDFRSENLEQDIISKFRKDNPNKFNDLIPGLMSVLQAEKKEDETSRVFEKRLEEETNKTIGI